MLSSFRKSRRAAPSGDSIQIESVARSHIGSVRELNEDNYLDAHDHGLWCVADGMGGHEAGEVASSLIIEELRSLANPFGFTSLIRAVESKLHQVNQELLTRAAALRPGQIIGSTVVILSLVGARFTGMWVGDSRLYQFRRGKLSQLSRDHSVVQDMVDAGTLGLKEARNHSSANIITRAVGVSANFNVDHVDGLAEAGDIFLLCSDGLVAMLEDAEICDLLGQASLNEVADKLILTALERTARDNITLILVRIPDGYGGTRQTGLLRRLLR
jgi:serine/threonine protein phosphatase PrpC